MRRCAQHAPVIGQFPAPSCCRQAPVLQGKVEAAFDQVELRVGEPEVELSMPGCSARNLAAAGDMELRESAGCGKAQCPACNRLSQPQRRECCALLARISWRRAGIRRLPWTTRPFASSGSVRSARRVVSSFASRALAAAGASPRARPAALMLSFSAARTKRRRLSVSMFISKPELRTKNTAFIRKLKSLSGKSVPASPRSVQ